jgi:hypothetical protein
MYTLKEAAESCGRGKTAILKSIQKGRVSAKKNPLGEWEIDPAELHRVYPPVSKSAVIQPMNEGESERWRGVNSAVELAVMGGKVASLEAQLERERDLNKELSRRLDEEAAERRRLTVLLTHQPKPEATLLDPTKPSPDAMPEKGKLWEKLFGKPTK